MPSPLRVYIINQTFHWFIVGLVFPILILFVLEKGLDIFEASLVISGYSIATTWEVAGIVLGFSAIAYAYLLLAPKLRTSPHAAIREGTGP